VGRPADTSLIARKLCDVRIVLVGSEAYLSAHGEPSAPEDLQRHACIIDTNFREPGRWPFRSADGETIAVQVTGRLHYSNAEACLGAAGAPPWSAPWNPPPTPTASSIPAPVSLAAASAPAPGSMSWTRSSPACTGL